ncbi:MAG: hypothetical protein M3154_06540, partial [Candidatus Eremiobacteraeota bacterium]|nr:hypothetical protein [Candidatus Eremiobacteraeota bacterium]
MQRTLARGVAVLFAVIGAGGVIAPRLSAGQFGIPSRDAAALAFVRATAVRDIILGGIVFASLKEPRTL